MEGDNSWERLVDPLDPSLKSEILRVGKFASICYTAKSNDRILWENLLFQESDKLRRCGYEIEGNIYANVRSLRSYFGNKRMPTSWIGFIAVCTDQTEIRRLGRRDIVVAFRGTCEAREWIQNLKDKIVPWHNLPGTNSSPGVGICKGFLGYYEDKGTDGREYSPRDIIESKIKGLLEKYKGQSLSITVTGHSMGGALATMSGYHIRLMWPSIPVRVFTFASPRVGNRAFASHMENIGVKVLRVKVKGDLVTKAPGVFLNEKTHKLAPCLQEGKTLAKWSYCHVGRKITLNPGSSHGLSWTAKFRQWHDVKTHIDLLEKL